MPYTPNTLEDMNLRFGEMRAHLVAVAPAPTARRQGGGNEMLHYALIFFLIAIVAAVFGFGSIAGASASIAKILFFLFLVVFLVTLVMGVARRA